MRQWLVAVIASTIVFFGASAQAEKRVALVIGNSSYVNIPRLANPVSDARLMADTLKALGFALVGNGPQLDLDEAGLRRVVQAFGAQLQGAEVGVFYFAGHGVQVRGANYLVPVGANPVKESDVDFQMLDTNLVLRQMEGAGTRLNVVILDACRNNPFGGRGLRSTGNGLAQITAPEGTLISFATQPGNTALDGEDGNSPYTKALAQTLRRPGLGIFDVFNEVGLAVKRATGNAQQPWVSSSPIAGTFYFAGAPAAPVPAAGLPAPSGPSGDEIAWSFVKDAKDPDQLRRFIEQFPASVRRREAAARLFALEQAKVAVVAPPVAPAAPPAPSQPTALPSPLEPLTTTKPNPAVTLEIEIGPQEPRDPTPATECDKLAAQSRDWEKAPGVKGKSIIYELDYERHRSEPSCRAALIQYPQSRRIKFLLGRLLHKERDNDERKKIVTEAVRGGSLDALVQLGDIVSLGRGMPRNSRRAVRLYEEAGQRGYAAGFLSIGDFYYYTVGDKDEARRWFEKAITLGYGEALRRFAIYFATDDEKEGLYRRAGELGAIDAYWHLGSLAIGRSRTPRGWVQAQAWFKKGMDAGDPTGAHTIGGYFLRGDEKLGIKKNLVEAERWFVRYRALGGQPSNALEGLASIAVDKDNPQRDEAKALALFDQLRAFGLDPSYHKAAIVYHSDKSYVKNAAKAFTWFLKAAEADPENVILASFVAQAYEKGTGVEKNLGKAREWYERAAVRNPTYAWDLAQFYLKGLGGGTKDANKAAEWILVAAAGPSPRMPKAYLIEQQGEGIDEGVIRAIQRKLKTLGLLAGTPTGKRDEATLKALNRLIDPWEPAFTTEQILAAR